MQNTFQLRTLALVVVLLTVLFAAAPKTFGQDFPSDPRNIDDEFRITLKSQFFRLAKGTQPIKESDRDLLARAARYYLYLGIVPQVQDEKTSKTRRRIAGRRRNLVDEVNRMIDTRVLRKNDKFRQMFSEELVKALRKGFSKSLYTFYETVDRNKTPKQRYHSAQVYLGLTLPIVVQIIDRQTEGEQRKFGNLLLELASRKDEPIAQLFAFKAMETYFLKAPLTLSPFLSNKDRKAQTAFLQPAFDCLTKPPANWKNLPKAELNGYRYLRCEAIKALGAGGIPAYPMLANTAGDFNGAMYLPVAYELIRLLSEQQTKYPPLTFAEKHAAAVALCRMKARQMSRYNPDASVKLVGQHISDLIDSYINDRELVLASNKTDVRVPHRYPWKKMAEELQTALKTFQRNLPPTSPASAKLQKINDQAQSALESKIIDTYLRTGVITPAKALQRVVEGMKVSDEIYQNAPEYKVDVK
ncbi:MAG: hypothetical protein ACFCD0_00050 [Gemmataceae bacterium]